MTTLAEDTGNDLWGHPRGLYICFATELWERFSFYGMKYLLLLYLTKYHLFSDAAGLGVLGSYASLVYAMPVLGGPHRRPFYRHAQSGHLWRLAPCRRASRHGV
jgi:dipeptide/tripeptide permease